MRIGIRTKIFLAFSAVIFISLVAIVYNFITLSSLLTQSDHIFKVIDPAAEAAYDLQQSFNVDIHAIEEYGNGYTSDADATEAIVKPAEDRIKAAIKIIEDSTFVPQNNTAKLKDILSRDEAADEEIFSLRKTTLSSNTQHIISPQLFQAIETFDNVSEEVSQEINSIKDIIEQHQAQKINSLNLELSTGKIYITIAFSLSIIFSIIIMYLTALILSKSIIKVRDVAFSIAGGELSQRISIKSKDEVGDLASAFNNMVDNIQKSQESLKKTTDELATKNVTLEEQSLKLKDQLEQLRKFQKITIDREMRMMELKEKLKECEKNHGKKYE